MFEVEWLSGDTAFACGTCGGFRDASRQLAVIKPPVHLIVTLNRFGFDVKTGKSHKVRMTSLETQSWMVPNQKCVAPDCDSCEG
jgi:ubiquitin C-terminal hydrolase